MTIPSAVYEELAGSARLNWGGCGDADGRGGPGGLALTGVDAGIASEALNRPSRSVAYSSSVGWSLSNISMSTGASSSSHM